MELKYVGDFPKVSSKGVGFDSTKADKYTYLHAAVELLEALSYGATETTKHLYQTKNQELNEKEILELLQKYCKNLDEVFKNREEKSNELLHSLIERVRSNPEIGEDEQKAWLKNIELMKDYYFQYVTNESAYKCALDALADEVIEAKVLEVRIPLFRNYGIVLHDLIYVLEHKKAPVDTDMKIETTDGALEGIISFRHPVKLSI